MHRKCINMTSWLFSRAGRSFTHVFGTLSVGFFLTYKTSKVFNSEEMNHSLPSFGTENNPTRVYAVQLNEQIHRGHVKEVMITLATGQQYPLVLIRTINGQLYGMKNKCIYDDETELKHGLLVRDKLICPSHGCEYNVLTGEADGPPAYNSIPIFRVDEEAENNMLKVYIPDKPPSEIMPFFIQRHYDDFRRISIIGTGGAGLGAAETLRRMGFTGEINLFTKETSIPFQKHNLTKYLDFTGKEKLLFYRTPSFYSNNQIKIHYAGDVKQVENSLSGLSHLQLKNEMKFLYDGIIIASGSNEFSDPFSSDSIAQNCVILTNPYNVKKSQELLKGAKNVLLYNLTPEGLEFASTLKTKRPDLNVFYLSPTNYTIMDRDFTPLITNELIEVFKSRGIEFGLNQRKTIQVRDKDKKGLITGYYLGTDKEKSPKVPLDIFYMFPSNDRPNIEFLSRIKLRSRIKFAKANFIEVDHEQRTELDNMFAAGSVAAWRFEFDGPLIRRQSWMDAFTQGENAAYNILALKNKRQRVPFSYYNIFDAVMQKVGSTIGCDKVVTVGNIKDLNFITFYISDSSIKGALACGSENNKRLLLIREALNLNFDLRFDPFSKDVNLAFEELFQVVNANNKASCFRSMAFENRYDIDLEKIIWLESEGRSIPNEDSFTNSRLSEARRGESK